MQTKRLSSMEKNSLNDLLRDRLDQYESPMDLDMEWETLAQLKRKKRRRPFMLWFLLGLGLVIAGGSIGQWGKWPSLSLANDNTTAIVDTKSTAPSTPALQSSTAIASPPTQGTTPKASAITSPQESPEPNFNSPLPSAKVLITPNKIQPARLNPTLTKHTSPSSPPINQNTIALTSESTTKAVKTLIPQREQTSISPKPKRSALNPIAHLPLAALETTLPPLPSTTTGMDLSTLAYSPWRIYAVAGLAQLKQRFKARDAAYRPYQKLREQTEQSLEAHQMEIGVQYYANQSLIFQAGFSYLQAYQRLDYKFSIPQTYELDNVLLELLRYPWGEEEIYGDTSVLGVQHLRVVHHNTIRSWDLNLSLGVQLLDQPQLRIDVLGGINWNWQTRLSGQIAGPESNTLLDLNSAANTYRSSTGLAIMGQVHLAYHWHPQWALLLRPNMTYQLQSNTDPQYPLESRWLHYGLNLGLKYSWFRSRALRF